MYPSAPLIRYDQDLEQRLEKKLIDVNSFNNHINNIKEMIIYFKDKKKSKKKYKQYKTKTTISKSFEAFVLIPTKPISVSLSLTGIGLIAIPIKTATACALPIGNKVVYEIIINKHFKYKVQCEKDQQTNNSLDKLYRKSLKDNLIDNSDYESVCNILTKYVDETKNESFF